MAETEPVGPELRAALAELAGTGRLLVACDYDGVLAPIVPDPARAYPLPAGIAALGRLAALPGTTVALVSGRSRADLAAIAGAPAAVRLVGGHGAELAGQVRLDPDQAALRVRVEAALRELVRDRPGVWLEAKPASLAVHTRPAARDVAAATQRAVLAGPASWPGIRVTTGKEIVELSVVPADKGTAVRALRAAAAAGAVLFLGDDATDEDAFAVLATGDVGVKVGPGDTLARFRVPDPPAAVRVLELVGDLREVRAAREPTAGPS